MAKLHFSLDGNSLGEFTLNKERMTIGRRPANDIHIDNLAVSGEHAVITTIGNDSFLEDMNSTNGTLVNSKAVKKHVLQHNDVIEFGKYQLLYINPEQAKVPANNSGFENTVVMRPAKLAVALPEVKPEVKPETKEVLAETPTIASNAVASNVVHSEVNLETPNMQSTTSENPTPASQTEGAPKVGRLQMLSGANAGRELTLNKALTTLGKPGVQVAVVTKRPLGYFITHVEGENLPLVNGQKIGLQAYALADHDVIDLSGIKMEFFLS
jgi:pSer/pThr/pTyr-binding forkhead associated (FHA) protein